MSIPVTKNDFKISVVANNSLSLVQFTIEWSGACQIMSPLFEELSGHFSEAATFYTIDVEKESGIEEEYGIMELPTILFFKKGIVIDHIIGLVPRDVIIRKIKDAL